MRNSQPSTRTAHMLALAYHVEACLEEGTLRSYAEVAKDLGLSRARVTQLMNLLGLAPQVQEWVLAGGSLSERRARKLLWTLRWSEQAPHKLARWAAARP